MEHSNPTPVPTHAITRILYGQPLREKLLAQVQRAVAALPKPPLLAIVQVGNNPASSAYIRQKIAACARVGVAAEHIHLNNGESETVLHATLTALGANPEVTAIIPQLPLPEGWDADRAINAVPALKDVDGLTAANRQKRLNADPTALAAATPLGVLRLLEHAGVAIQGQNIAVIGRGRVVGQPLREMLRAAGAHVIEINKDTPHPQALCREAAVVCAAAGVPGLVTAAWLKPGAVVMDIGLTRVEASTGPGAWGLGSGKKLVGDVDTASIEGVARLVTAVPGGVGPLTVASLLTNVADAACLQQGLPRPEWIIQPQA